MTKLGCIAVGWVVSVAILIYWNYQAHKNDRDF